MGLSAAPGLDHGACGGRRFGAGVDAHRRRQIALLLDSGPLRRRRWRGDPLNALMQDQVEGLRQAGVRAVSA